MSTPSTPLYWHTQLEPPRQQREIPYPGVVGLLEAENDPRSCITPPESYRASVVEHLADRSEHSAGCFRLERTIKIPKPYDLVTADQAKQFGSLRNSPGHSTDEVELFRGAVDLVTPRERVFRQEANSGIWFTHGRTAAASGGYGAWRVFARSGRATGMSSTGLGA